LDQTQMNVEDDSDSPIPMAADVRPKTVTVLGVLIVTAFTFSFLGPYADYNALVTAGVVQRFTGPDPRPKWLAIGFVGLLGIFLVIGMGFRLLSKRQFKAIDAMADAKDNVREGWYET
jgi:hypothetical protein